MNSEEVVQIEKKELNGENLRLRENIEIELKKEGIPFNLIKGNKFIPVHQQVNLIKFLRNSNDERQSIPFPSQLPTKVHFDKILALCHEYLFNVGDRDSRKFPLTELSYQTKYYIYNSPRIKALIKNQNGAKIDTKIRGAFALITHWFEFALPRYFTAFQNIYNFVVS